MVRKTEPIVYVSCVVTRSLHMVVIAQTSAVKLPLVRVVRERFALSDHKHRIGNVPADIASPVMFEGHVFHLASSAWLRLCCDRLSRFMNVYGLRMHLQI